MPSVVLDTPVLLRSVAFPDRYLDVCGSMDGKNLIGYPNGGQKTMGVNQTFTISAADEGAIYIRGLVYKDHSGNWYPKAKTVVVQAVNERDSEPLPDSPLRAGSQLFPLAFYADYDQSTGAYKFRAVSLDNSLKLYITLPNGNAGTEAKLLSNSFDNKQLWQVVKSERPDLPVPGYDE